MKVKDKVVGKIEQKDVDALMIPLIAIYDHPRDYPDHIVARLWDTDIPTNLVMVRKTIEEMHAAIKELEDVVYMPRQREDDPVIIGVYFC